MKYIEEKRSILISAKELIRCARRGISQSLPLEENEPSASDASLHTKRRLLGDIHPLRISKEIDFLGYTLKIISQADDVCENSVTLICEGEFNPKRPKKEYREQLRGEAFIFAYILLSKNGYKFIKLNTVYVNSSSGEFERHEETVTPEKLEKFFEKCIEQLSVYAVPEIERVTIRNQSMKSLRFPYKAIRQSQREFMQVAHKTLARGGTLFATAPTGTGKTVSALYPAIRAMGEGKISKTFYLTPKGTTALAAKECIELFSFGGVSILGIILSAKEKICTENSVCKTSKKLCRLCEFNRLSEAVLALYNKKIPVVTEGDVKAVAAEYRVCPYELSLSYSELCDVIICDFNYLFDTRVYIRRYFDEGGEFAFLIDEAHNLPDRAREMFSAEISEGELISPTLSPLIDEHSSLNNAARAAASSFLEILTPYLSENVFTDENGRECAFAHLKEIPYPLYDLLSSLLEECELSLRSAFSAKDAQSEERISFIKSYLYKASSFYSAMNRFGDAYELFLYREDGRVRAKIFCIDTARDIAERLRRGKGAIFFSATLEPLYYYKSVLGNDSSAEILKLPSPFDSSQLSVSIMDKISTRYSEREDTLGAICKAIAAAVSAKRGNYIVFSPSFEYNRRLCEIFRKKYPKIKVLMQRRDMSKKEKEDFLGEFSKESPSYLIGFCVMGGIYSEGIDLAGDALIGAIVVGIGMPTLSYEREAIQAYYSEKFDEGREFAYVYPGVNRVLQAAGRVIRREDDRGIIVLIDDRFADPIYKKVIPNLWSGMKFISSANELNESVKEFWDGVKEEKKYNFQPSFTE